MRRLPQPPSDPHAKLNFVGENITSSAKTQTPVSLARFAGLRRASGLNFGFGNAHPRCRYGEMPGSMVSADYNHQTYKWRTLNPDCPLSKKLEELFSMPPLGLPSQLLIMTNQSHRRPKTAVDHGQPSLTDNAQQSDEHKLLTLTIPFYIWQ